MIIEITLLEGMITATSTGFMLQGDVDKRLRARIPPLISFLRHRKRYRAEAIWFFFSDIQKHTLSPVRTASFILDYIASIDKEGLALYKAGALINLHRIR